MATIKAVLFGVGNMGSLNREYLVEKDVEITGVVSKSPSERIWARYRKSAVL